MKPYVPKQFDPGRLIYKIDFYQENTTDNGSGGTIVNTTLSLSTKAARVKINEFDQLAIAAGATYLNNDYWFVIRKRKGWDPEKDMLVTVDDKNYTIRGIIELNEPVTYIKLLCVWRQ